MARIPDRITVFTDGAARQNPGPGGWAAIILTPDGQVVELGGRSAHTTNNKMEMSGALEALRFLRAVKGPVDLYTDSSYLVRGMNEWIRAWRRRGWKTIEGADVLNRDLWEHLASLTAERGAGNEVAWNHIRGHAGIPGNERADEIATQFADREPVGLYRGPVSAYDRELLDLSASGGPDSAPRRSSAKPRSKGKPYSYLSVVDGRPMRHATWDECERRVKGKSGARFKKAMSALDEAAILEAWGFRAADVSPGPD